MIIKIVYFAYLVPNRWQSIVEEQLNQLAELPLYQIAKDIQMSIIYEKEKDYHDLCKLLKEKWPKVVLGQVHHENTFEYPGILNLYTIDATGKNDENTILLYFHSKGMTSNLPNIRKNLFEITIANYQEYLNAFENDSNIDIAGYAPHVNGFIYFNFFWIRSSYIHKWCPLPIPNKDRFIWEIWFGEDYSNKKKQTQQSVCTWSPVLGYDKLENKSDETWKMIFNYINH
jgi:hypothetical protein